jgi:hypothetical protein
MRLGRQHVQRALDLTAQIELKATLESNSSHYSFSADTIGELKTDFEFEFISSHYSFIR